MTSGLAVRSHADVLTVRWCAMIIVAVPPPFNFNARRANRDGASQDLELKEPPNPIIVPAVGYQVSAILIVCLVLRS